MINSRLLEFLKGIHCNDLQFKLLCFLSRYPKAKFDFRTLLDTMNVSKIDLRETIEALVHKGIIVTSHHNKGLITYALTQRQYQEYIDELTKLDRNSFKMFALLIVCR